LVITINKTNIIWQSVSQLNSIKFHLQTEWSSV
jgi:hypothetical protein